MISEYQNLELLADETTYLYSQNLISQLEDYTVKTFIVFNKCVEITYKVRVPVSFTSMDFLTQELDPSDIISLSFVSIK